MANTSNTKKKVHLSRPTNERRAMCGRTSGIEETDQPKRVTCVSCKGMYQKNKNWYSSTKRKATVAAKKVVGV